MAKMESRYKKDFTLERVEDFVRTDLNNDKDEQMRLREMNARKYLRKITKENQRIINELINEYLTVRGEQIDARAFARINRKFAEALCRTNDNLYAVYLESVDGKTFPKIINTLNVYGMYCFNEFQKAFIREFKAINNKNAFHTMDLTDFIVSVFHKNFGSKDCAVSKTKGKLVRTFEPLTINKGFVTKGSGLYFNSDLLQVNRDWDLAGAVLNTTNDNVKNHIEMYITSKVAMLINATQKPTKKTEYIRPYEVVGHFRDYGTGNDYKNSIVAYDAYKNKKNPYFVMYENMSIAQLEVQEIKRNRMEALNDMEEEDFQSIEHDGGRFVLQYDGRHYFTADEFPLDKYSSVAHEGSIFVYQGDGGIYNGQVYMAERDGDSLDMIPVDEDEMYVRKEERANKKESISGDGFEDYDRFRY